MHMTVKCMTPFASECLRMKSSVALRWRQSERDGVSNHQPHGCLLNHLFRRRSKKTSKLRVTGLCVGNSPGTGEFPAQMASNAENVSIWWRHHGFNGDKSGRGSTHHEHGRIWVFSNRNLKKTRKYIHNLKTCPKCILVPNKIHPTISKPCITSEPWNRQQC